MTRKMRSILSIIMAMIMVFAITACSKNEEPAKESGEETQTEEQTTDDDEEYNIASHLVQSTDVTANGEVMIIDTDHFTLTLSLPDTWTYEQDNMTSITFYNIAGREADCGGKLFTLTAYEPGEEPPYDEGPHLSEVGRSGGKVYVASYPTDVQADYQNEQHMKEYETVYAEVMKIEAQATDSPLVLK